MTFYCLSLNFISAFRFAVRTMYTHSFKKPGRSPGVANKKAPFHRIPPKQWRATRPGSMTHVEGTPGEGRGERARAAELARWGGGASAPRPRVSVAPAAPHGRPQTSPATAGYTGRLAFSGAGPRRPGDRRGRTGNSPGCSDRGTPFIRRYFTGPACGEAGWKRLPRPTMALKM